MKEYNYVCPNGMKMMVDFDNYDETLDGRIRHKTMRGGYIDVVALKDVKKMVRRIKTRRDVQYLLSLKKLGFFKILNNLSPREQKIISMRFLERLDLETVGKEFGVTRERIRQIETKALRRLIRY